MFIRIIKSGGKSIKIRVQTMHHKYFRGGFFTIMRTVKMTKKGAKEMHAYKNWFYQNNLSMAPKYSIVLI